MDRVMTKGFTLLEVAISVTLITAATMTLLSTSTRDITFSYQNRQRLIAQSAATKALEHYARFRGYNGTIATTGTDGLNELGNPPYTLSIPTNAPSLIATELAELPAGTATLFVDNWYSTGATAYEFEVFLVTVVVSWTPSGGTLQSVRLATLVSNEGFDKSG